MGQEVHRRRRLVRSCQGCLQGSLVPLSVIASLDRHFPFSCYVLRHDLATTDAPLLSIPYRLSRCVHYNCISGIPFLIIGVGLGKGLAFEICFIQDGVLMGLQRVFFYYIGSGYNNLLPYLAMVDVVCMHDGDDGVARHQDATLDTKGRCPRFKTAAACLSCPPCLGLPRGRGSGALPLSCQLAPT